MVMEMGGENKMKQGFMTRFEGNRASETQVVDNKGCENLEDAEIEEVRERDVNGNHEVDIYTTHGRIELVDMTEEDIRKYLAGRGIDGHELGVHVLIGYDTENRIKYLFRGD